MQLGAYIKGYRCISPCLSRLLPGRTLPSPALANGEGRGVDTLVKNCRYMRRDVDRAASLRTTLYQGCSFVRPSPPDPSLALRMTEKALCTRSFAAARNDRKTLCIRFFAAAQNDRKTFCIRFFADAQNDSRPKFGMTGKDMCR